MPLDPNNARPPQDVESLSDNFAQLREAQARFSESADALSSIPPDGPGRDVLVPLTGSMYVPGTLGGTEEVLVDVGTGFYVGAW
jgi:prefoldin alpha subunit